MRNVSLYVAMRSPAVLAVVITGSGLHKRVWTACEIATRKAQSASNNAPH